MMSSFEPGLFVGGEAADLPVDNLDLERWFKGPKVTSAGSMVIAMPAFGSCGKGRR